MAFGAPELASEALEPPDALGDVPGPGGNFGLLIKLMLLSFRSYNDWYG